MKTWVRKTLSVGVLAAGALLFAPGGVAHADVRQSNAAAENRLEGAWAGQSNSDHDGILSGIQVYAPIDLLSHFCGDSFGLLGHGSSFGSCANDVFDDNEFVGGGYGHGHHHGHHHGHGMPGDPSGHGPKGHHGHKPATNDGYGNGTEPATNDGYGGTEPATNTPGGTKPATHTPGHKGTKPATNTPGYGGTKPASNSPGGTKPASNTPGYGGTKPASNMPGGTKPATNTPGYGGTKPATNTPKGNKDASDGYKGRGQSDTEAASVSN